jgi:hypothetical protein
MLTDTSYKTGIRSHLDCNVNFMGWLICGQVLMSAKSGPTRIDPTDHMMDDPLNQVLEQT